MINRDILLIFALGLTPPVLSWWLRRQAEVRAIARLRAAREAAVSRGLQNLPLPPELYDITGGGGEMIGDRSCRFNARSTLIRCAVNPQGPCQGCPHYQPRE